MLGIPDMETAESVNIIDVEHSLDFLGKNVKREGDSLKSIELGGGVGRVSLQVLCKFYNKLDIQDFSKLSLDKAKESGKFNQ
jgi:hypothetical protein